MLVWVFCRDAMTFTELMDTRFLSRDLSSVVRPAFCTCFSGKPHTSSMQFLWTVDVIYGQKLTWNNREWQFKRILDNLAKFKYQCKGQLSLIFLLQLMQNDSARTEELINGASQMEACVPTDWPERGHKKSLLRSVSAPREKALGVLFPSAGWLSVWFYSISRHSRTVACKCQYPL